MKIWSDERLGWLGLYLIPGLGNSAFKNLLEKFGNPKAILQADFSQLIKVPGIREETAQKIVNKQFGCDPEKELKNVEKYHARIMTYLDTTYPELLKEIPSPPMILYVRGKEIPANKTFIAIVGSRNPTHYGVKAAENIGFGLARRNVAVVSGLATGIDSAAHRGCLRGKGFTLAVMGTGIDRLYPESNEKLFQQILESGAVISEFPTGSPPEAKNFPIRNRIISGLCRGVAVVEATKKSGSLITAAIALDQGREVFAVPGSIESFKSRGTHFLIKEGARLIENADDILDELGMSHAQHHQGNLLSGITNDAPILDESEQKIYDILSDYPMHIDHIVRKGDMNPARVSSILMQMELRGLVRQLAGKRFVR